MTNDSKHHLAKAHDPAHQDMAGQICAVAKICALVQNMAGLSEVSPALIDETMDDTKYDDSSNPSYFQHITSDAALLSQKLEGISVAQRDILQLRLKNLSSLLQNGLTLLNICRSKNQDSKAAAQALYQEAVPYRNAIAQML